MRATCNPDPDSFVAKLIDWWIDQDTGYPIPERSGVLRWFIRVNEKLLWADTPEELRAQYPDIPPRSFSFIASRVYDNQILLAKNPEYLANLMALPLVERERLLGGNWKIRPTAGKLFNRTWFEIVDAVPAGGQECLFFDLAASEPKMIRPDPDYTAGTAMRLVNGVYYVLDCVAVQDSPTAVDRLMVSMASQCAARAHAQGAKFAVRWEQEGGAAGVRESLRLTQMLAPHDALGVPPQGDKVTRAKGLAAQAEAGNVKLLRGDWTETWLAHMHSQPEALHDDIMDSASGAFNFLANQLQAGLFWL